ncbi:unnamed protein product [Schistosoma mattheei]|uniref:Uncharacterized protein n=1 Tax=Schistosoma mattheei TaxID=31246 RepID=A0A3P7XK00_9TREM|nr:unnamed protein product [Schistosoma mattheei]
MRWWSGLPIVMKQPSYTGWNNCSSRSYHVKQVILLTVQRFDGSKVFPSDNHHDRCCLPTRRGGVRKGRPQKCTPRLIPRISVSGDKVSRSTELTQKLPIKWSSSGSTKQQCQNVWNALLSL